MNPDIRFWKQFIYDAAINNTDYLVRNSIKDFHFKGLNYICFKFSPILTIRLYITEPSEPLDTKNVNIHNHLYDSEILVLTGKLINNTYSEIDDEEAFALSKIGLSATYNKYLLTSALAPSNKSKKILVDYQTMVNLTIDNTITLESGDRHFQDQHEIHNVENDTSVFTSWLVFEYPTVKERSTLYSKKIYADGILPTKNAYNRYNEDEIINLVGKVLDNLK